jgi:inhibitor of KinA sporulation pathway (predicted exonuclease)
MKIIQDLVVLDLEATSSQDDDGFQKNDWIIQIAAVYLKRNDQNNSLSKLNDFNRIVKPKEDISEFIESLTGISNEAVQDKNYFDVVGQEFLEWVASNGSIKNVRLCAWGNYFDIPLLRKNYQYYKINYPFSGTAFDVKTYASLWMMLSGRRTDKLSVEHVCNIMGLSPKGKYHDALTDAHAEADILLRIFDDLSNGFFIEDEGKGKNRLLKIYG